MSSLSVAEVAAELGVSQRRVRQMLADDVLDGEHVGRAWVVNSEQLRWVANRRPKVGRPWSPASAWAVLALADGADPELSPVERSRAKKRLALGLDRVVGGLSARAARRKYYAHPGVLARMADAPEVVRSGVSAVSEHGVDLIVADELEGYVRTGDLVELVRRFGLEERSDRSNVVLRVVDDAVWPFLSGQASAGRAVVAVDLLEAEDPRSQRAGAELLARP